MLQQGEQWRAAGLQPGQFAAVRVRTIEFQDPRDAQLEQLLARGLEEAVEGGLQLFLPAAEGRVLPVQRQAGLPGLPPPPGQMEHGADAVEPGVGPRLEVREARPHLAEITPLVSTGFCGPRPRPWWAGRVRMPSRSSSSSKP